MAGNDSSRPDPGATPTNGRGTAPPAGSVSVGTVAQEAARLLEVLSERGGAWPGAAGRPRTHGGPTSGATDEGAHDDSDAPDAEARDARHVCTCGGTTPQACRICPVCQLISFVSSVNPDTIDRVADVVGFAATALRDLATAQRGRQAPGAEGGTVPPDRS